MIYYDIQHALNCEDYLLFIAFDPSVSTVSVKVKDLQVPTMVLEALKINYVCISHALYREKLRLLLHFEKKEDKLLY